MTLASETLPATPAHQRIYEALRAMLLFGELPPGRDVTLLGLAEELGVSITPVREAVRRLIAERALQFHGNRRISVPRMSAARLTELYDVRALLEPELAARAVFADRMALADHLENVDAQLDTAIRNGEVAQYLRLNYQFHFAIYSAVKSEVYLPMVESLWLQVGPFLRVVCGRMGTTNMIDHHKAAIAALRDNDAAALKTAINDDLKQGFDLMQKEAAHPMLELEI